MLELFPGVSRRSTARTASSSLPYTDASGEERMWHVFGGVRGEDVARRLA